MINQRYVRMMLFEVRRIAVDFSAIEIGYKYGNLVSVLKDREAWTMQGKPVWLIEAEIATLKSEDKLSEPKPGI